jgi:hypothetical protein
MSQSLRTSKLIDPTTSGVTRGEYGVRVAAIRDNLKMLGVDRYDLRLPETAALPYVLRPDEYVLGIVYGRYKQDDGNLVGRGALVITPHRFFLLDKKFMFVRLDEIVYEAISGVDYERVSMVGTITIHTKIGDIRLRTLNRKCARSFVEALEMKIYQES